MLLFRKYLPSNAKYISNNRMLIRCMMKAYKNNIFINISLE